jgi:hypothetical protein
MITIKLNIKIRPKYIFLLLGLICFQSNPAQSINKVKNLYPVYKQLQLEKVLAYEIFENAYRISDSLSFEKNRYLSIIDYNKPSTQKRFFIIDKKENRLLYHEHVAHGMNTGNNRAKDFSNTVNSKKSSLGFFKTEESYFGKNGYSLRLKGLEKGINDNARDRAIVIHGATYVSPEFIKKYRRLGRSWGCPALPEAVNKQIIDLIKEGSCLLIYAEDPEYFKQSKLYNKRR